MTTDGDGDGAGDEATGDRGWRAVWRASRARAKRDQVPLLSAGVAFYSLLAVIPALAAAVSVYGLVGDPDTVGDRVHDLAGGLPASARDLLEEQLRRVLETSRAGLSISAVVAIALAVWSASSGIQHLVHATNAAYGTVEGRGAVRLRLMSLGLTVGAVLFTAASVATITVLPRVLDSVAPSEAVGTVVGLLRWPLLTMAFLGALATLYRFGPDRVAPWRWVTPGALVATVGWIIGSVAFSVYADHLGSFNRTYGALAGVVVLMLWLLLTATVLLTGAELNGEIERRAGKTTQGDAARSQTSAEADVGYVAAPERDTWVDRSGERVDALVGRIARNRRFDAVAVPLTRVAHGIAASSVGPAAQGRWLGHPAHPMFTDLPIGCWTSSALLDVVGGRRSRDASQLLIAVGVLSAAPTLLTGFAELAAVDRLDEGTRRVAAAHAVLNAAATAAYAGSWSMRRRERFGRGVVFGSIGAVAATAAGHLGGDLAFRAR